MSRGASHLRPRSSSQTRGAGYTYFRDGDIVIAKITPCFENGKGALAAGLTNGIAFGTTELHVLRTTDAADRRFMFYITLSDAFRRLGEADMYGAGGQKRISESFVRNFSHPLPSLSEQRAIAAFLDLETTRIDELVAKKERLIELLQEQRTALITCTVTKGIEPNGQVSDTDSNVFRQIPATWELRKLRRLITRIERPVEVDPDGEYREIGIRSWGRGIFHKDAVRGALLEDKSVYSIEPGDSFSISFLHGKAPSPLRPRQSVGWLGHTDSPRSVAPMTLTGTTF